MRRRFVARTPALPDLELLLTVVVLVCYLLFWLLFVNSAITLDGACLYTFWLPDKDQISSPYWLVAFLVTALLIWAVVGFFACVRCPGEKRWVAIYYVVVAAILAWWAYNLIGLWEAMQYERGEISAAQYFGDNVNPEWMQPHQCEGH
jgi:hypothetical protein